MTKITISNLSFSYYEKVTPIFKDLSLQLDSNWKLGLISRNGKGKTTFLKILSKQLDYHGVIQSALEFEYFPSKIENTELNCYEIFGDHWQLIKELNLLEFSVEALYRPYKTLSQGEQTKLQLASLFSKDHKFLLIDEPTNHLDSLGRSTIAKYLQSKSGFILVSHDRNILDQCVDHILALNRQKIQLVQGNFSSWYENKQLQDAYELKENDKLKREIHRLEVTAKEKAVWSDRKEATKIGYGPCDRGYIGHKAAKMMKRSIAIEQRANLQVEEKKQLLKDLEVIEDLKIHPLIHHSNLLVKVDNLSINYDEKQIFTPLSFQIKQGGKYRLKGINGSGKSSILRILAEGKSNFCGSIDIAKQCIVSYICQDAIHLSGSLKSYEQKNEIDVPLFRAILHKLDFEKESYGILLENYSDGQKKKILIAKSLSEKAHLYIWDEPLNFIDVFSRIQIEKLLVQSNITCIFVEHDETFCERIATEEIIIK